MKFLFYVDPARLYDAFLPSATVVRDHLWNFCGRALAQSGSCEIRAIIPEIAAVQLGPDPFEGISAVGFPLKALRRVFPEAGSLDAIQLKFFHDRLSSAELDRFSEEMRRLLGDFEPDIVISYPTNFGPLLRLYPKALGLVMENGVFSRYPFPHMLRFDAVGFMHGFCNRFHDEIWSYPLGPDERDAVRQFRADLCSLVRAHNPFSAEIAVMRSRFRHLVLCPVPAANFYGEAGADDQLIWLTGVLDQVPADVGVLVTFHDNVAAQLNARTCDYLKTLYPNLLTVDGRSRMSLSMWFLPEVDAVLNCETMTGAMGLVFGTRVISLDRTYSAWMSEACGLADLADFFRLPVRDSAGAAYWLLTHFSVCPEKLMDPQAYARVFSGLLENYRRSGVTFSLYGRCNRFSEMAEGVLDAVRSAFAAEAAARKKRKRSVAARLAKCFRRWAERLERLARV